EGTRSITTVSTAIVGMVCTGDDADAKAELILRRTSIMLIAFVLLFVFSCVLALSPEQLAQAKAQNVSVLSYLANATDNPFIA
ncbi:hypothetical protein OFC53_36685, partial [Escherichia coli]|nr:hypothetical protein [Escherichia coli]